MPHVDTVEARRRRGTRPAPDADQIWERLELSPFNNVWFGRDFGAVSDTSLGRICASAPPRRS
jgi:hypothetical protein